MAEPLNNRTLEHYLNFVSDGFGMKQIDEPIGFDAANFVIEQDKGRYGRDISFAGEDVDFMFTNTKNKYGFYFDRLLEYDKIYGFESEIEYLLRDTEFDIYYVVGQLDFQEKTTDQATKFSCKMIQSTTQAILERRVDTKVDLFSDEDLDGNYIEPVQTKNILIKAKPIVQKSEWQNTSFWAYTGGSGSGVTKVLYQNPISQSIIYNIENTLNGSITRYATTTTAGEFPESQLKDMVFIDAINDLNNISINIKDLKVSYFVTTGENFNANNTGSGGVVRPQYRTYIGTDDDINSEGGEFTTLPFTSQFIGNESINRFGSFTGTADRYDLTFDDITIDLSGIPRGFSLYASFYMDRYSTITEWLSGTITITATSTAIDTVTRGVRLVDAMKQVSKSINSNFVLNAPRFDVGGEWYDNFVFDGNMIRGRESDFVMTWKDIANSLQEFNSDYEIDSNNVFVGKYDDFYTNTEIGNFLHAPDETFNLGYNERYTINAFNYKYKNYNQDKDDNNTIDGVHTEYESLLPNKQVENTKKVEIDFIRDPFLLATTQKQAASEKTTSLSQDDKVFIIDVVPLAPSSRGGFSASLTHFVNSDGYLQLLGEGFNWNILGFSASDVFTIENTANAGNYNIIEITNTIITLEAISITPTTINTKITQVSYPLSNVEYSIRTNEGFNLIENILAPDNFANLKYTPKRNILNNWSSYLKTATKYKPELIKTTYFKNGGELVSQFGTGAIITEKANIEQSELSTAILTPRLIKTKVRCDFSTYRSFAQALKTDRGFVRVYDNEDRVLKGYAQKSSFKWADNELEFDLEEKFESEYLEVSYSDVYIINEVGYDSDLVPTLDYKVEDDYIQFFDANTRPLTNKTRFDFVRVEGVIYDNIIDLTTAISLL